MSLGVVARADGGGLGVMTQEIVRHLQPDAVLIIGGDHGRGPMDLTPFEGSDYRVADGFGSDADLNWLFEGCDVAYSAETFYRKDFCKLARRKKVRTVLHAMPELFVDEGPDQIYVPTPWAMGRMPKGVRVLPVPVSMDRFTPRLRERASTFLIHGSPAMLDRNGAAAACAAVSRLRTACNVVVRGNEGSSFDGAVRFAHVIVDNFHYPTPWEPWARWSPDVLVMPRRYAGLSLPMQEAMAQGAAVITTDLEPQRSMVHGLGLVPANAPKRARMRGGTFDVYNVFPQDIAERMNYFLENPRAVQASSQHSLDWAEAHSWRKLRPMWEKALSKQYIDSLPPLIRNQE